MNVPDQPPSIIVHKRPRQNVRAHTWAQGEQMGRKTLNPSLASDAYIRDIRGLIRNVVSWCEKQPWHEAIVGYCAFPMGEGITEHALKGLLFDTSPPMHAAFRQFARERYGPIGVSP